jgi:hypothetical protein
MPERGAEGKGKSRGWTVGAPAASQDGNLQGGPAMKRAYLFPGQGAQVIGMGRAWPRLAGGAGGVRRGGRGAGREAVGADLGGRQRELTLTANAQPALMATSMAALRALEAEGIGVERAAFRGGAFAGRIFGAVRGGALTRGGYGAAAAAAGQGDAGGGAGGRGRDGGLLGLDFAATVDARWRRRRRRARSARRRTTTIPRRWWCRATGRRWSGRWRSPRRGGEAGAAAAGERALPLRADAAGRRGDGGGAGRTWRSRRRGCRWCPTSGRGGERPRGDPRAAGAAGDGPVRWRESVEWMAGRA